MHRPLVVEAPGLLLWGPHSETARRNPPHPLRYLPHSKARVHAEGILAALHRPCAIPKRFGPREGARPGAPNKQGLANYNGHAGTQCFAERSHVMVTVR